ncbi:hypothetical protein F4054_09375 [Candidatus Poribacteria bacterium]|nr:hypothetical protein [Candidatus Poribacteria bacterium]MYK22460.1 hypothetical protein [Candidatus Poribacteria bacterium]
MKNRLFPIIIGLCFVSLIGVAFLHTQSPKTEAPVESGSIQETAKPTEIPDNNGANPLTETDAFSRAFGSDADVEKLEAELSETFGSDVDMDKLKEALRSKDIERMKDALGPEMAARIDAGMKFMEEKMEGVEEGEFPDFNLQEYMNIFAGEDGPKIDLAEISQNAFRRHFPKGEPADYETEMAERIHNIVADTPGDFQKVMMAVTMGLAKEQDFQFWALANFKGEIGQQMQWMTEQILVAGELENIQYTVPEDMSTFFPTLTEVETQDVGTPTPTPQATTSTTASTEPPSTRSNESGTVATEKSQTELASPMSVERIKSIRELLSQDGTDAGLLKLLETDKEAANYLLERFSSSTEIEEWLTKQAAGTPPTQPRPRETRLQLLPPEVQP